MQWVVFFGTILLKMKKINVLVLLLSVLTMSSCLKTKDTYDAEAQMNIEKPLIQSYVETNLPSATLDGNTGIWFEVLAAGDPESYEYKTIGVGGPIEAPVITVKYTLRLLNGTVVEEVDTEAGYTNSLAALMRAWHLAFLPSEINGEETSGLTASGLKKGSKIRFVTPSFWAYQNNASGSIPANSPLDFYIEVLKIEAPTTNSGI